MRLSLITRALAAYTATLRCDRTVLVLTFLSVGAVVSILILLLVTAVLRDVFGFDVAMPHTLNPTRESGLAERFNQALLFATATFLVMNARRTGNAWFAVFALLFGFAAVDDAFLYHERVGALLTQSVVVGGVPILERYDLGELAAWSLAGILFLVPVAFASRHKSLFADGDTMALGGLFTALAVFAIFFDRVHGMFVPKTLGYRIAGIVEDGGEMLVTALTFSFAFALARRTRDATVQTKRAPR